ncbi:MULTISPECIES: hypothetical protein [Streptomyces]|uniref:hypothetical protein n=1 Tax=Streptomyces TaxID=1883 RepID=UPI00167877CE|nr:MULTISPECIES: hypothetical protein [Streptomyces]WGP13330.1 hypothetical protein QFA72_28430 [Streptomyces sp. SH5]GGP60530.1 hypothetical protein GCM10010231_34410 [Streptomyces sindenensis]
MDGGGLDGSLRNRESLERVPQEQASAQVRADFTAKVRRLSRGALVLPEDYTPRRIILTMQLKNRDGLTPEYVFGFSQITMAQTAKALAARGVTVEVVDIPEASASSCSPPSSVSAAMCG